MLCVCVCLLVIEKRIEYAVYNMSYFLFIYYIVILFTLPVNKECLTEHTILTENAGHL